MRMEPHSRELLRLPSGIDLGIEEVGHSLVIEGDAHPRDFLRHGREVLDVEQVVCCGDAETAHLCEAVVAKEQQLRPGSW